MNTTMLGSQALFIPAKPFVTNYKNIANKQFRMIADVDYDIFSHLGFVQNIDLDQKGVYVIQVSLFCGDSGVKIAPVGLFSAPNGLESFVEEHKLSSAVLSTTCEIVDHKKLFRSRSFVVRYKSEIHELNEGVHWRLTLPNVDLTNVSSPSPVCKELLQLKFELMFCGLLDKADVDLQSDINKLIPENPVFGVVATQDLIIQRAGTGLHEYYPVRFVASRYLNLDVMIHCAVTGIRFRSIPLSVIPNRTSAAAVGESPPTLENGVDKSERTKTGADNQTPSAVTSTKTPEDATSENGAVLDVPPVAAAASSGYTGPASPYSTVVGGRDGNDSPVPGSVVSSSAAGGASTSNRRASLTAGVWRRLSGFGASLPAETPESVAVVSPEAENAVKRLKNSLNAAMNKGRSDTMISSMTTSDRDGVAAGGGYSSAGTSHKSVLDHLHGIISATSTMIETLDVNEVVLKERNMEPSDCGLLGYEIESLVGTYANIYIKTFNDLVSSCREFINAQPDLHWQVETEHGPSEPVENGSITKNLDAGKCLFEINRASVCSDLMHVPTVSFVTDVILDQIALSNSQLSLQWSNLVAGIKKAMRGILASMKATYEAKMNDFWRMQVLVHTKSMFDTHRLQPAEEQALLTTFQERMRAEMDEQASMMQLSDSNVPVLLPVLARGLRVFDASLHAYPLKIPYIVLQQYVGDVTVDTGSTAPSSGTLPEGQVILVGGCFDNSLKSGTVYLSFGGKLLHCANPSLNNREIVVDVFPLVSLGAIFKETSLGAQHLQTHLDRFQREQQQLQQKAGEVDVTLADIDHAQEELSSSKKAEAIMNAKTTAEVQQHSGANGGTGFKMGGIDISNRAKVAAANWKDGLGKHKFSSIQAQKKAPSVVAPNKKTHLIVLQHGFLGTSYDMRYIENAIRLELPSHVQVFSPKSNEEHSQDSIAQMAKRLAFELIQYCKEKMPSLVDPYSESKISFIGHSMGGLIIRLALQEATLKPILPHLHTFLSLSTPHLGTQFSDSQLVSTGMWAMFKFKKCRSLKELALDDGIGGKLKKTLLYKMSLNGVLSLFHKVILVSSPKDQYVPTYSARIQISKKIESDETVGSTIAAMTANILCQLRPDQLVRVTLDNNCGDATSTNSVNAMIGRTAHICYLENQQIAVQVIAALRHYFA